MQEHVPDQPPRRAPAGAYISTKVWNSIPEEYRTIIQEEFTKGAKELTDFTNASFDETKAKLEKEQGCSFNEVDVDAFRAAVQPEYDRMVKEDGVTAGFFEQAPGHPRPVPPGQ